jgi:hypothetical protein
MRVYRVKNHASGDYITTSWDGVAAFVHHEV